MEGAFIIINRNRNDDSPWGCVEAVTFLFFPKGRGVYSRGEGEGEGGATSSSSGLPPSLSLSHSAHFVIHSVSYVSDQWGSYILAVGSFISSGVNNLAVVVVVDVVSPGHSAAY